MIDNKKGEGLAALSLWDLRDVYDSWHQSWSKKLAAEVAFALAVAIKRAGESMGSGFADAKQHYFRMARGYAAECVALLTGLSAETYEDVATQHTSLVGVTIPERFYLAYVRSFVNDASIMQSGPRFPEFIALLS